MYFVILRNKETFKFVSRCVLYLEDAGSSGHALQYAGLIAVLQEDGSVVVNILPLDEHGGCACPPAARRTVVYVQKQTHSPTHELQ